MSFCNVNKVNGLNVIMIKEFCHIEQVGIQIFYEPWLSFLLTKKKYFFNNNSFLNFLLKPQHSGN